MRRLSYLQGLRGLAALTVVIHHYFCAFYPVSIFGTGIAHGSWEHLFWVTPLGVIGSGNSPVCLFFILSGFVLSLPFFGNKAKETSDLLASMVKRPIRLVGLVTLTMILAMVLMRSHLDYCSQLSTATGSTWLTEYDIPPTSWLHFAKDLITDPFGSGVVYNTPLWTISFELIGSYITFLFLLLFRRSQLKWIAYLIVGLQFIHSFYIGFIFGIFCADVWTSHSHRIEPTKGIRFLVIPLLLIGIYLASFESYMDPAYYKFTWHAFLPHSGHSNTYPMIGAGAIFASLLLSSSLRNLFSIGLFVYLGRISYAMYAIHLLVLRSVSSWIFLNLFVNHTYDERVFANFCVSFLFILVIAHFATVKFDEKVIKGANAVAAIWMRGNR